MNGAIWKRAVGRSWRYLAVSCGLVAGFAWLLLWVMSRFPVGAWGGFLRVLPDFAQPLLPVPLAQLATPAGQVSVLYVHIVPLLICVGWAIGQASDATAGEIARGTMEHLAALPLSRASLLLIPALLTTGGAVLLALSLWLGNWLGLVTLNFPDRPPAAQFLPGAANLAAMVFALAGITALVAVWHADRWRALKLAGGVFVLSSILTIAARAWPAAAWLDCLSFLSAFEPQKLILAGPQVGELSLRYDGTLLVVGTACYGLAAAIFTRRDLPVAM